MRGAIAAQLDGVFERYVDEMFRHMWAAPKKMDDPEVVRSALEESGFNAASLMARTQEPEVKDRLLQNTQASVARGTFGAPTFFVGDEIFFGKDRLREIFFGKDRLRDVEEEIVRANA
ncbi:DSBA oxidoreductase (fragment) [Burkholderiales bacterium]